MQKRILWFALNFMMAGALQVNAQYAKQDSTYRKCFIGSTIFMISNLIPDNNPPGMVYLNIGYRIAGKDVVSLEFKTWKYAHGQLAFLLENHMRPMEKGFQVISGNTESHLITKGFYGRAFLPRLT